MKCCKSHRTIAHHISSYVGLSRREPSCQIIHSPLVSLAKPYAGCCNLRYCCSIKLAYKVEQEAPVHGSLRQNKVAKDGLGCMWHALKACKKALEICKQTSKGCALSLFNTGSSKLSRITLSCWRRAHSHQPVDS